MQTANRFGRAPPLGGNTLHKMKKKVEDFANYSVKLNCCADTCITRNGLKEAYS